MNGIIGNNVPLGFCNRKKNIKKSSNFKIPFFVQKIQKFEKLEKCSIFIFCVKIDFFWQEKNFEIFEFSRLNWSKIVIS